MKTNQIFLFAALLFLAACQQAESPAPETAVGEPAVEVRQTRC